MTDVLNTCPTCGNQSGHCRHTTEGQVTTQRPSQRAVAALLGTNTVSTEPCHGTCEKCGADCTAERPTKNPARLQPAVSSPSSSSSSAAAAGGADFYRVEIDTKGCAHCGHDDFWTVTWDQDGEPRQISTSSNDKESIKFICESMNSARELALRDWALLESEGQS